MFIISITYTSPVLNIDKKLAEHIDFLNEHYRLGHFQLSGRKVPRTGGVILATVKSRDALEEILENDPFNRDNLATYEVVQFVPTKSSEALAFLIEA